MSIRVDVYASGGIASGVLARADRFRDVLEQADRLDVERATWTPFDGSAPSAGGNVSIPVDDAVVVVSAEDPSVPVHAVWHAVHLRAGPYVVEGELPTLPGFDPGRALTRPSGSFVHLRDVRVRLAASPDGGVAEHAHALVNRYAVDEVASDLMLAFFFPGAHSPSSGVATGG